MKMKVMLVVAMVLALVLVAGCSAEVVNNAAIYPISREEGSGTRSAFVELFDVREELNGKPVDATIETAEVTNSTSVMMTSVAGDRDAVGYISFGSLNATVKALKIEGVAPSVETIKDGTYPVSRPFNIILPASSTDAARDFISFMLSAEGQDVVAKSGYVKLDDASAYANSGASGKVVVAGSSSVTPLMEKLKEAYVKVNGAVAVEIQESDSTTGVNSTLDGLCDIGMISRELKESESAKGLIATQIAVDGIVVIVNNSNTISGMTKAQVRGIYLGEMVRWSDVK